MWCDLKIIEHEERKREGVVTAILDYVDGTVSFLTYRNYDGKVHNAIYIPEAYLSYVIGLHAANPDIGGIEITPMEFPPDILEQCDIIREMEAFQYGGAPLVQSSGTRSTMAALGTQIDDVAFRLVVCRQVQYSPVVREYVKADGKPKDTLGRYLELTQKEIASFVSGPAKPKKGGGVEGKEPPHIHARIIMGANDQRHITILQQSMPPKSVRPYKLLDTIPDLNMPPHPHGVHSIVLTHEECNMLDIIPSKIIQVPMDYGNNITTGTQAPVYFPDIEQWVDNTTLYPPCALFAPDGPCIEPGLTPVADEPNADVTEPEPTEPTEPTAPEPTAPEPTAPEPTAPTEPSTEPFMPKMLGGTLTFKPKILGNP